jgi:hypothetical protein
MKVKVTRVAVKDTKKDGSQLLTKAGNAFWNVGIQTEEHGDQWLSCLAFNSDDKVKAVQEGDSIDIAIEENGDFKNFRLLGKIVAGSDFEKLEEVVVKRGKNVETLYRPYGVEAKEEEVDGLADF